LAGQSASLDESLTGAANLVMIAQLCRIPRQRAKQRAAELLERFDLADAADRGVKTYSGGMRRRLDLAASLVTSPPVLFLDEPTTGLDPRSRLVMWDIIRTLVADGTTVLLTTQYLEEADQLADQIIVIDDGVLIARGSSKELKDRLGGDRVHVTVAPGSDIAAAREVLARHSDGDVLLHAITDALLGAIAAPDIGTLFPPSDPQWKGADSAVFLREALKRVAASGYELVNLDSALILAAPKIGPHAAAIRRHVAELCGIAEDCIGLKAKTPEGTGTDNAAIAHVTVLLQRSRR